MKNKQIASVREKRDWLSEQVEEALSQFEVIRADQTWLASEGVLDRGA